ncbi:hypothetical protein T440DRAFT_505256, partial [Plenodomus tracheiphilus IPT5]
MWRRWIVLSALSALHRGPAASKQARGTGVETAASLPSRRLVVAGDDGSRGKGDMGCQAFLQQRPTSIDARENAARQGPLCTAVNFAAPVPAACYATEKCVGIGTSVALHMAACSAMKYKSVVSLHGAEGRISCAPTAASSAEECRVCIFRRARRRCSKNPGLGFTPHRRRRMLSNAAPPLGGLSQSPLHNVQTCCVQSKRRQAAPFGLEDRSSRSDLRPCNTRAMKQPTKKAPLADDVSIRMKYPASFTLVYPQRAACCHERYSWWRSSLNATSAYMRHGDKWGWEWTVRTVGVGRHTDKVPVGAVLPCVAQCSRATSGCPAQCGSRVEVVEGSNSHAWPGAVVHSRSTVSSLPRWCCSLRRRVNWSAIIHDSMALPPSPKPHLHGTQRLAAIHRHDALAAAHPLWPHIGQSPAVPPLGPGPRWPAPARRPSSSASQIGVMTLDMVPALNRENTIAASQSRPVPGFGHVVDWLALRCLDYFAPGRVAYTACLYGACQRVARALAPDLIHSSNGRASFPRNILYRISSSSTLLPRCFHTLLVPVVHMGGHCIGRSSPCPYSSSPTSLGATSGAPDRAPQPLVPCRLSEKLACMVRFSGTNAYYSTFICTHLCSAKNALMTAKLPRSEDRGPGK